MFFEQRQDVFWPAVAHVWGLVVGSPVWLMNVSICFGPAGETVRGYVALSKSTYR
jgi:hypothetical protein